MTTGNHNKERALGMPYGTAMQRLKKAILFRLVQKLNLDFCYRCGKRIKSLESFTIEHKEPWLTHPDLFWDMTNIAFSHRSCNSRASSRQKKGPIPHGTQSGYSYRNCRCDACKEAHRKYQREWKAKRKESNDATRKV